MTQRHKKKSSFFVFPLSKREKRIREEKRKRNAFANDDPPSPCNQGITEERKRRNNRKIVGGTGTTGTAPVCPSVSTSADCTYLSKS
jgi:hypothetical protein